jgi:hypothetical protein
MTTDYLEMLTFFKAFLQSYADAPLETDGWLDILGDLLTEEGWTLISNQHYVDLFAGDERKVTVHVRGGLVEDVESTAGINVQIIDWDNLSVGCCPLCGSDLTPIYPSFEYIGQVAGEYDDLSHFFFICTTCGWKEDE